ncbi:hypothetical protein CTEN210_02764 [Chaetoceros tenuissimus]|uniref:EXS domain-containing protein n=1 Tax=Chaetoceros tenuissimus TaxID=426638 RepID=A0AAD3CKF2_9STRA|nr:hypothetical protein CTEN210_02764 [Chaetoceros tenuissimus]
MSSGQEVGSIFGEGHGYATALLRSPTVIIASIALWGMNVCLFRLFGIDYAYVLMLDVNKEKEEQQKKKLKENKSDEMNSVDTDDSDDEMLPINIDDAVVTPKRNPFLEITEVKLLSFASVLILTLYLTSFVYIQVMAGSTIGAIFMFYFLVLVGVLLPLPSTAWIRSASSTVFLRAWELVKPRCTCITGKPRPVPFVDVFFADAMCSMSKVFFDWGMLWILASHYPSPVPPSLETIIVPSCFAAMPYLIRARQCLIMYNVGLKKNCPKRYQHILNALKYSSSLFPLIVSAYMKTVGGERNAVQLEKILIALMIINATYCLIWDIVMDWGMLDNPSAVVSQSVGTCIPKFSGPEYKKVSCLDAALRPRLRFGTPLTVVVVLIDICLRYAWTLRFVEHAIFPSNDAYILCTEFLEVFRRAVWNLLRVEWEHIKQSRAAKKNSPMRKSSTA